MPIPNITKPNTNNTSYNPDPIFSLSQFLIKNIIEWPIKGNNDEMKINFLR